MKNRRLHIAFLVTSNEKNLLIFKQKLILKMDRLKWNQPNAAAAKKARNRVVLRRFLACRVD